MKNEFLVSPMIQKIKLKAGETYTDSIMVANPQTATEDFYYKASLSPYSVLGEGYAADFETMSDWSRIVEWTTLKNDEGVLKPNESKKLYYTIKVPEDAPAGGQYLKIGITSNNPVDGDEGGRVQTVYEMASLVFAEVEGETRHEGKIIDSSIPGFVTAGKPTIDTTFVNDGNVHETATTTITLTNVFGGGQIYPEGGEDGSLEFIIMPQTTRLVSRGIPNVPVLGVFEVKETISYMGDQMDVSTIMIVCPVWFILFVLALIASIVGMFFYRRHLKQKKFKKPLHSEETSAKIES